jgi:hypothetical protein
MKKLLVAASLLIVCTRAFSQLTLNAGETYSYYFTNLPFAFGSTGPGNCPWGRVEFAFYPDGTTLHLATNSALLLEMFEGTPDGSPFLSRTLTSTSSIGDFIAWQCSHWFDNEGSIRLTMLSGSAVLTRFLVRADKNSPCCYSIYSTNVFPVSRPALSFVPSSATLALSWPTSDVSFVLEAATNLVPPFAWQPVTNAPQTSSANVSVTVDYRSSQRIFRLRNP